MFQLPPMIKVCQDFHSQSLLNIDQTVQNELNRISFRNFLSPDTKVAITVGSRDIADLQAVITSLVDMLKRAGTHPFIIPAMGSHGGATATGQRQILEHYGITLENVGAPVKASMETVQIDTTSEGVPVFVDRYAKSADYIVVVNRVKPHTDFEAANESGLLKMMAIGLGKQNGAEAFHQAVVKYGHYNLIKSIAESILKKVPIAFGLALVENQNKEIGLLKAIPAEKIEAVESDLLVKAKEMMPRIPFDPIDLLIVDRMGKDVSGTGMDQSIIARTVSRYSSVPDHPVIKRIFVHDLTENTDGNAVGIGNADFTTKRLVEKIDHYVTAMNCVTGVAPELARIPLAYDSDCEAIQAAMKCIGPIQSNEARIVHIKDTAHLRLMDISENMVQEMKNQKNISTIGDCFPFVFDEKGNLAAIDDE